MCIKETLMRHKMSLVTFLLALIGLAALCAPRAAQAQGDQQIYTDWLQNGWQNWSWCGLDGSSKDYVHSGAASCKITYTAGYQGFYLHCDPMSTAGYTNLSFWINGGASNGRNLEITGLINNNSQGNVALNSFIAGGGVAANTWRLVTVPLSAIGLGKTTTMTGFWIGDTSGGAQAPFYVDDITLIGTNTPLPPQTVSVDFKANRHAISPQVYGLAYASPDELADLNVTLNRSGGNAATSYNWKQNASNHANDWFFESLAEGSSLPGDVVDGFINSTRAANAQAMITIPTIGWVAKVNADRSKTWSFSQKKYGAQTSAEGDAGNGVKSNGQYVTGNDPNDANVPSDSTFQQDWVKHIVGNFGLAAKGGQTYYLLDNEPAIWYATHRDVHPIGPKISEVTNKIIDYAAKIKAVDPGAQVVGPEEWGWSGYFYSGYDMQYGQQYGWGYLPDRASIGGWDAMPWMLNQLHQYDTAHNAKSLDVFSLHYYPQSGEYGSDVSTAQQLRRNRSTRSLWDPNYVDESWIGSNVQLIPRMKTWVNTYYPGLKTALTEYSWGADAYMNGATTQADILGIFGREGLDMASRWTAPDPSTPTYQAIKMYRNVDGTNQTFGDVSVADAASDPDNVSSFAAVRSSDGAQTVMVINKALTGSAPVTVSLANCVSIGVLQTWQLTGANAILHQPDTTVPQSAGGPMTLNITVPAQSVTLLVIPAKTPPPPAPPRLSANAGNNQAGLSWTALAGVASYNVKRSLKSGGPYTTLATVQSTNWYADKTATNGTTYYYVVSANYLGAELSNSNEASATPSVNVIYQINAGGNALCTYSADAYYSGGGFPFSTSSDIDLSGATNPAPSAAYQSVRANYGQGDIIYTLPNLTPGKAYTVRLQFEEMSYINVGDRIFNVSINGKQVLANFDQLAAAGGRLKAVIKEFTVTADGNGNITLGFQTVKICANIAAIEVIASSVALSNPTTYQIDAGGGAVGTFAADAYYSGGGFPYSTSHAIDLSGVSNPAPMAAYQSVRTNYGQGDIIYTLPNLTPAKTYTVRLHFQEMSESNVGGRLFNVSINGTQVLTNFDQLAAAGAMFKATIQQFSVPADAKGKITLTFHTVRQCANIAAIEVLP